jgi:soluble lytic murein transglycosylase-like protein/tetratricopeptide (TPR) repeat protein
MPGNLEPSPTPSLFGRRQEAYQQAVAFIQEERYPEALAFIRRAPRDVRGWKGLMSLEAALLSREDPRAAMSIYDRILGSDDRSGVHFVRGLSGYKFLLNDLRSRGDYSALFRLVQLLSFEWRNREARELIRGAMGDPLLPGPVREEMARMDAIMAMRHGDYRTAEAYFAGRADRPSYRWLATLRLRQGDFKGAAEARIAAAGTLRGAPRLRELQRALECLTKGGMPDEALALMEEVPELRPSVPAWRYFLGISHLVKGEPEKALELLEPETAERDERGQRAQYFMGRALEMLLRHPEAADSYARAAGGAFTYYRILALGRLARLNGTGTGPVAPAARLAFLLESPTGEDRDTMAFHLWLNERLEAEDRPQRGTAYSPRGGPGDGARARASAFHYLSRGAPARAVMELKETPGALPRGGDVSPGEHARLLMLSADTGEYRMAIRLMAQLPYEALGATGPFRYNHPPGFSREVLAGWRRQGVPPQLTMAVMLIESAFQPDVVSASNARGLMQLLPSTAERVSAVLGERLPREEELFGPPMNIRYGTCYLGLLLDSFKSVPLALASYNGGPFNIRSLIAARRELPTDLLIETIPVSETAAYVRKNMEAVYAYEEVYLGEASLPDLTVPARMPVAPPDF